MKTTIAIEASENWKVNVNKTRESVEDEDDTTRTFTTVLTDAMF